MDRYISLHLVIDNILDHPMLKDLSFERAVNYTQSFMRIVGCPRMYNELTALVEIKEYRGLLPCNLNDIILVRTKPINNKYLVFRSSTDSFHMSNNKLDSFDLTYKVLGNVIFTSLKEGTIEIAYNAFVVDDDGFPMIPDDSSFIRALELYIKKQVFTVLFDMGKIQQPVYNNVCQEYSFAVGLAQNSLTMPSIDEMESLVNSLNTLVPRVSQHKQGFVDLGTQEHIRLH